MCGIAGFINSTLSPEEFPNCIANMLALIAHRGPDESGFYFDDQMAFGTTRLNIIDIKSGHQPMQDSTGRYWICYNGEIYNYKELRDELCKCGFTFVTACDTEVALYACIKWGVHAFERLNGAFAFAFYDKLEHCLILVRDRYGERPLYYYQHPVYKGLVFSSEIKAFLAHPLVGFDFDIDAIASILTIWTPLPTETAFQNIKQVPMSSYLIFKENTISIKEYEPLNFSMPLFDGGEEDSIHWTREVLKKSVSLRLRSDVTVGTYLSGGLDSAIVTQLAVELGAQNLQTFSVAFAENEFDESKKQNIVSQYLNVNNSTLHVSNDDIATAFPDAVWHAEVPLFRTALVPMFLLSKMVQEKGIKVVLTGEGADELFLGYDIFREVVLRELYQHNAQEEKGKEILQRLYSYEGHYREENFNTIKAHYKQFAYEKVQDLFSHEIRFHNSSFASRCLLNKGQDNLSNLKQAIGHNSDLYRQFSSLEKAQWLEFKTLLSGYLLSSQGDRMSLGHGVENRCPFLDVNVFNCAASLPEALKLRGGVNEKFILKQAFKNDLPETILTQPKQPYRAPDIIALLSNPSKHDYLNLILSEQELKQLPFINLDFCQKFLKKIISTPFSQVSPRENQAFVQLLSLALLNKFFIHRDYCQFNASKNTLNIVKKIDGRILHGQS